VCGFVAFDAGNLDPIADIVRQLGAALRGVRLYREAVEARQLAEEGERLAEGANRLKSRFSLWLAMNFAPIKPDHWTQQHAAG